MHPARTDARTGNGNVVNALRIRWIALIAASAWWCGAAQAAPTLAGKVVADPRLHTRIAADQAGTLEPPPGGFPLAGARVSTGQVLAYLRPSIPGPERSDLDAQLAAARRDVTLGELQVRRFNISEADQFDGQRAMPSLQILGDYQSAKVRQAQLEAALEGRVALVAPTDATLLSSRAQRDRVLAAGDPVFDLTSSSGMAIEVLTADPQLDASSLKLIRGKAKAPASLQLLSEQFDGQLRARRLLYAVDSSGLAVGELVTLSAVSTQP